MLQRVNRQTITPILLSLIARAELEELGGNEAKTIVRDGLKEGGEALRGAMQVQGGANKAELQSTERPA